MNAQVLGTKDFARTTLRPRHRPVVRALAEAMYSPTGEVPDARLDAFVDEVDGFISPASKTLRFALKLMLDVMRLIPIFVVGTLATFDGLDRPTRIKMLEKMDGHRINLFSMILAAYKTLMTIVFYEHPDELRRIGYPGEERRRYKSLPQAKRG
jgi:hypothetical protein